MTAKVARRVQSELNGLGIPVFAALVDQSEDDDGKRIELLHYDSVDEFWPAERKFLRQVFAKCAAQYGCEVRTTGQELLFELLPWGDESDPARVTRERHLERTQVTVSLCPCCGYQEVEEEVS